VTVTLTLEFKTLTMHHDDLLCPVLVKDALLLSADAAWFHDVQYLPVAITSDIHRLATGQRGTATLSYMEETWNCF
jgi:hypothetical protein